LSILAIVLIGIIFKKAIENIVIYDFNKPILIHDSPSSKSVRNIQKRIKQMTDIQWTPLLNMPRTVYGETAHFTPGVTYKGFPYSSVAWQQHYIGTDVSFETFMTAVKNPNSIIYTVDLTNQNNRSCIYGLVCSSYVLYALGETTYYTASKIKELYPLVEEQSGYGAKVGDILVSDTHTAMVSDIIRYLNGGIFAIEVSEETKPICRRVWYGVDAFDSILGENGMELHRPTGLNVDYTPSEFVLIDNKTTAEYVYNEYLMLDKGNKANYYLNDAVELTVVNATATTSVYLTKNGGTPTEIVVANETPVVRNQYTVIDITSYLSGVGEYVVSTDAIGSNPVTFRVVNPGTISYSNGVIRIAGYDNSLTPDYYFVARENTADETVILYKYTRKITDDEITAGEIEIDELASGDYFVRVVYGNNYGRVFAESSVFEILAEWLD
jgi:hypothetical protein